MRHTTDETLLAYVDDELAPEDRERTARHVSECTRCRAALDDLTRKAATFSGALRSIDRPPPRDIRPPSRDVSRRGRETPSSNGAPAAGRAAAWRRRVWLKAAVLLLALTGVASALPGSPVREWVTRSARTVTGWIAGAETEPRDVRTPDPGGVAARIAEDAIHIGIERAAPEARIRVRRVEGATASVQADGVSFRTAPGRIEVDLRDAAPELIVEIPDAARTARIEVNGEPAWLRDGADVRVLRPITDSTETEIVFRAGT